jgi:hypothetical protein
MRRFVVTVGVVLVAGCSMGKGDGTKKVTAALTVPLPPVTQFVILASRTASFNDRTAVTGGHIGVAAGGGTTPNTLNAGFDTHIGVGEVLLAPQVTLAERATTGEIGATTINAPASDVTGPRSAFVAPPAQPVPGTITAGTTAVTVASGQTRALAPGAYGAVSVTGTLNLSGGLYQFQSLLVNNDARVLALAASTVRIASTLTGLDRVHLLPSGALPAGALRFIVGGATNAVTLGTDAQLTALVVARGDVTAGDRLIMNGSIAGRDVIIAHDGQIGFSGGFACGSNASCTDSNDCTTDTCGDAACTHVTVANGSACSDGNACTRTDRCQSGVCVGSNPVACTASDQCHVAGVCSPATGVCSTPIKANGTACNDGNACTLTDSCQGGVCTGSNPVVCAALDPCHDVGVCNPATAVCSNPNKADGTACDDGDKCTQNDACKAGVCAGNNPNNCGNVCFLGDSDGDGVDDCHDLCIHDATKTSPGMCGCGVSDVDRDGDGVPDCKDQCPDDSTAQFKGACGCPSAPAAAGTVCDDGVCRGVFACDGAGQCGAASQCQPQPGASCQVRFFDKKYYWFCPGPVGWTTAEAACRSIQTSLVQIDGTEENAFVAHNLFGGAPSWIGGNDKTMAGTWRWATAAADDGDQFWTGGTAGQPYFARFNDWSAGTPLGNGPNCASTASTSLWTSGACGNFMGFVCEVPTDRTVRINKPPHGFCDVLGIPCTEPPPIGQCNATSADVFGTMTGDQVISAGESCDTACANVALDQQEACAAANCSGPVTAPPPGSTCTPFGAQSVAVCLVTATATPPLACAADADCPTGSVCGVVQGCPSDQTGLCPATAGTGATRYCGTPVPGCPTANDTGFPDRCDEVFLCDGTISQPTTGFDPTTSDLTPTVIDPEKTFPTPDSPSTTEPYPDRSNPCVGPCGFAAEAPNHPWCKLAVEDDLTARPSENPTKSGKSGDIVSFEFDPQLRLDHTLKVGPFGNPEIDIGAEAGVTANVNVNVSPIHTTIHALDVHAQLKATQCAVSSDIALKVLDVDFTPLLTSEFAPEFPLPLNTPSAASQAACQTAYDQLRNAGDRAKKALRDALELMRQRHDLTVVGHDFDQATFCASVGADAPPAGFPPGDCTKDNPETTINRFIEYYKRTVAGFHGADGAKGLAEAISNLNLNAFSTDLENLVLYQYQKDEEQTLLQAQFLVGPIPVNLELLGTLSYGASVKADIEFNPAAVIEQVVEHNDADTATQIAFVGVSGAPSAAAGLGLFAGIGFGVDGFKAKIGIEGDLQLGTISVPASAGAGIGLGSEIDKRPPPADMTPPSDSFVTGASLVPSKRYVLDLRYSAGLGAQVRNILSGNIDAVLKLKIAFFSKKWRQRLFSFNGFCSAPVSGDTLSSFPPLPGCDLTLVSLAGSTDVAGGGFPWGEIRLETPFPELKPFITNAVPLGSDPVDLSRVQQFFYDSLCTCIGPDQKDINHPNLTRSCFRDADCCPLAPTCFHDHQLGGSSCITCRNPDDTCNVDSDCCTGNICSHITGRCQPPSGCDELCTRDAECRAGTDCLSNICGGAGCLK